MVAMGITNQYRIASQTTAELFFPWILGFRAKGGKEGRKERRRRRAGETGENVSCFD